MQLNCTGICRALLLGFCIAISATPAQAQRRGGGSHSSRSYSHRSYTPRASRPRSYAPRAYSPRHSRAPRSSAPIIRAPRHGRIKRSAAAKDQFMRQTGHPHGWPGHVVDHVTPLACGGADAPSNMQWQTTEAAKAKDKVERIGCGRRPEY